jgi:hypothetical protein
LNPDFAPRLTHLAMLRASRSSDVFTRARSPIKGDVK